MTKKELIELKKKDISRLEQEIHWVDEIIECIESIASSESIVGGIKKDDFLISTRRHKIELKLQLILIYSRPLEYWNSLEY